MTSGVAVHEHDLMLLCDEDSGILLMEDDDRIEQQAVEAPERNEVECADDSLLRADEEIELGVVDNDEQFGDFELY